MPPTAIRCVLFDLGDTLIDFGSFDKDAIFAEATRATYDRLAGQGHRLPLFARYSRLHARAVHRAFLWSKLRGREFNSLWVLTKIAAKLGLPHDEAAMIDLAWNWYGPLHRLGVVAPDVAPTLRALRDAGIKIGLVSNTFIAGPVHDRHLAEARLLELLPMRIYSCDIGYPKPHRRIFNLALQRMNTKASETLFVGNLVKIDMVGAKRVGMMTALRQTPSENTRLRDVDHVIEHIGQILPIVMR